MLSFFYAQAQNILPHNLYKSKSNLPLQQQMSNTTLHIPFISPATPVACGTAAHHHFHHSS
jgi:hypothetical protein